MTLSGIADTGEGQGCVMSAGWLSIHIVVREMNVRVGEVKQS